MVTVPAEIWAARQGRVQTFWLLVWVKITGSSQQQSGHVYHSHKNYCMQSVFPSGINWRLQLQSGWRRGIIFQLHLQPRWRHGINFQFRSQPRSRHGKTVSNDNNCVPCRSIFFHAIPCHITLFHYMLQHDIACDSMQEHNKTEQNM